MTTNRSLYRRRLELTLHRIAILGLICALIGVSAQYRKIRAGQAAWRERAADEKRMRLIVSQNNEDLRRQRDEALLRVDGYLHNDKRYRGEVPFPSDFHYLQSDMTRPRTTAQWADALRKQEQITIHLNRANIELEMENARLKNRFNLRQTDTVTPTQVNPR